MHIVVLGKRKVHQIILHLKIIFFTFKRNFGNWFLLLLVKLYPDKQDKDNKIVEVLKELLTWWELGLQCY